MEAGRGVEEVKNMVVEVSAKAGQILSTSRTVESSLHAMKAQPSQGPLLQGGVFQGTGQVAEQHQGLPGSWQVGVQNPFENFNNGGFMNSNNSLMNPSNSLMNPNSNMMNHNNGMMNSNNGQLNPNNGMMNSTMAR